VHQEVQEEELGQEIVLLVVQEIHLAQVRLKVTMAVMDVQVLIEVVVAVVVLLLLVQLALEILEVLVVQVVHPLFQVHP
tara:strand:+ start:285 stop:521 length:237 start_codon:yes stop_codon:yes gene_type:complete